ncbi:MAG: hypothetical protein E7164_03820 [Firmicutes bacterium]|nr:hypothetical protein [Bacillota bacterium]
MEKNNLLINLWQNKRVRAIIFLIFWIFFIVYVFAEFVSPYQKYLANQTNNTVSPEEDNEHSESIYFEDLKQSLLRYNFDYVYTVTSLDARVIYKGTMMGNETTGYKESVLGIEKYYLNGVQIYKDELGNRVLQEDKTTNVYNGYLSVDKIIELLEGQTYTKFDNEYRFQINGVYVKIVVANDNIARIEIIEGDNNYLLEFSNVNEIKELNY